MFNASKTATQHVPPELRQWQQKHEDKKKDIQKSLGDDARTIALKMFQEGVGHAHDILDQFSQTVPYWEYVYRFDRKYVKHLENLVPEVLRDIKKNPNKYIPKDVPKKQKGPPGGGDPAGGGGMPPPPPPGGAPGGPPMPGPMAFNSKKIRTAADDAGGMILRRQAGPYRLRGTMIGDILSGSQQYFREDGRSYYIRLLDVGDVRVPRSSLTAKEAMRFQDDVPSIVCDELEECLRANSIEDADAIASSVVALARKNKSFDLTPISIASSGVSLAFMLKEAAKAEEPSSVVAAKKAIGKVMARHIDRLKSAMSIDGVKFDEIASTEAPDRLVAEANSGYDMPSLYNSPDMAGLDSAMASDWRMRHFGLSLLMERGGAAGKERALKAIAEMGPHDAHLPKMPSLMACLAAVRYNDDDNALRLARSAFSVAPTEISSFLGRKHAKRYMRANRIDWDGNPVPSPAEIHSLPKRPLALAKNLSAIDDSAGMMTLLQLCASRVAMTGDDLGYVTRFLKDSLANAGRGGEAADILKSFRIHVDDDGARPLPDAWKMKPREVRPSHVSDAAAAGDFVSAARLVSMMHSCRPDAAAETLASLPAPTDTATFLDMLPREMLSGRLPDWVGTVKVAAIVLPEGSVLVDRDSSYEICGSKTACFASSPFDAERLALEKLCQGK